MTPALERPPYARAALLYALVLPLAEFLLLPVAPSLFRAMLVADAATGWLVVAVSIQALRAVPYPPPTRWVVLTSMVIGHWLAAVLGAAFVVATSGG